MWLCLMLGNWEVLSEKKKPHVTLRYDSWQSYKLLDFRLTFCHYTKLESRKLGNPYTLRDRHGNFFFPERYKMLKIYYWAFSLVIKYRVPICQI